LVANFHKLVVLFEFFYKNNEISRKHFEGVIPLKNVNKNIRSYILVIE